MPPTLPTPASSRFFEDYEVGATYPCGSFTLTEAEIIAFARVYDPQVMHTDPVAAAEGPFGGIIASGWQTVSCAMHLLVENFLPFNGLAAPGIDELRWPKPARPDQMLTLFVTVTEARRSRSKPDRGLVTTLMEVKDPDGEVVLSMRPMNFIRVRHPA